MKTMKSKTMGFIAVFFLISCISAFAGGEQDSSPAADVYTAGSRDIGNRGGGGDLSYFEACYWKNSVRIDLHPTVAADSRASSITVVGTDVYVAGSCDYNACYWKNGVKTDLSVPGRRTDLTVPAGTLSRATSITVVGTDVYIAGHYGEYNVYGTPSSPRACYWINGRRTDLSVPAGTSSQAASIAVVGTDVYIAGHYGEEYDWYTDSLFPSRACYWKNGVRTDLHPYGTRNSSAASITVVGTDVYVAGDYTGGVDYDSYYTQACYWKNGVKTDLSVPTSISYSSATSITVVGMDVYVAGNYRDGRDNKACYWKNGRRTDLSVPARASSSYVTSIAVVGTDVYVAGDYVDDYDNKPCYWINDRRIDLPAETSIYGGGTHVTGIAVSR